MSKYITFDFHCDACEITDIRMLDRDNKEETQKCEVCSADMCKLMTANICKVSYPDGTTQRFKSVKEQRQLKLAARRAKQEGNKEEVARINREVKAVREGSHSDREVAPICKAKPLK